MNSPCQVKKFYDTEFEATRAAAIASYDFQAELIPYHCPGGNHWHIANKLKELRSRVRPHNRTWCDACGCYMKPGKWKSHITRAGHQKKERDLLGGLNA
jgi:hypothetical protein